jgi:DNA-directed RNA polymerase subunit RPC12/RpoP
VTSPSKRITIRCPGCGDLYETWWRPSVNVDLDPGLDDPAYLEEATTGACPACGRRIALGGLVVRGDVWEAR